MYTRLIKNNQIKYTKHHWDKLPSATTPKNSYTALIIPDLSGKLIPWCFSSPYVFLKWDLHGAYCLIGVNVSTLISLLNEGPLFHQFSHNQTCVNGMEFVHLKDHVLL